ncbi:MAG: hypothetical protein NC823_02005, partial [Candidatus Omnitrophica bacterium]|nr:hypothetical protein [Candidatus Omnitrophota bacterium]
MGIVIYSLKKGLSFTLTHLAILLLITCWLVLPNKLLLTPESLPSSGKDYLSAIVSLIFLVDHYLSCSLYLAIKDLLIGNPLR